MGDSTDSMPAGSKRPTHVLVLFKGNEGQWYNRTKRIRGGQIVQVGGEGLKRRATMLRSLRGVFPQIVGRELVRVGRSWEIRW